MYALRPYQQKAVEKTLAYFRQHREPGMIVLPTGAGKSLVIAELARLARGRVLVLAHVKELVEQNYQKFINYGLGSAGIFSAGLERKDHQDKVIFGSIQSVARAPKSFFSNFTLVVIDECHRVSADEGTQYTEVIAEILINNPQVCILGLTATPYRLDQGWIYQYHNDGIVRTMEDRFFRTCIFEVSLGTLIKERYLTPPVKIDSPVGCYDFSALYNDFGEATFSEEDLEKILRDQRRVTPGIVKNIIELASDREGVMIFTSTTRHAREVLELLPKDKSAIILGSTPLCDRDEIVSCFKAKKLKYLVNVSVLTTGFDAPHVDLIALLRPTESVSLFQQIIGRGLRLSPGKQDCLILDYTGVEHEVFRPEIGQRRPTHDAKIVEVECPKCHHENEFWGIVNESGEIEEHFGDSCQGASEDISTNKIVQCGYLFRSNNCIICGAENDKNARSCSACYNKIVSDEEKLRNARAEKKMHIMRPDSMQLSQSLDKQGRDRLEIRYYDYDGHYLSEYFYLSTENDAKVFFYNFIRMHHRTPEKKLFIQSPREAMLLKHRFRLPLFIIAEKQKNWWRVREKIFR
jgi:DNA repair protein RadD